MGDKVKKRPISVVIKRWTGQKVDEPLSPKTPPASQPAQHFVPQYTPQPQTSSSSNNGRSLEKPKRLSIGGISELVQCSICLNVLLNPKMLPCQHTFCMACLTGYVADRPLIECPICHSKIHVSGPNFLNNLPSNLYIDSLLQIVGLNGDDKGGHVSPNAAQVVASTPQSVDLYAAGVRCSHCKTMCDNCDVTACKHCKLNFCRVCWSQHLDDLRTQIGSVLKQLDSAESRLLHKVEHYKDRCERVSEQINQAADEKMNAILERKDVLLKEVTELQKGGDLSALALQASLEEARVVALKAMNSKDSTNEQGQVTTFINLHQNALQILEDVSKWDSNNYVFDKEGFCIEQDTATPLDAESDDPLPECGKHNEPLDNEDSLVLHYRSRNFVPHYVWKKTSRPGGVGIGPWDNNLYVCGMDTHCILVVERSQAKIVSRLTCEDMLCPAHIAFMKSTGLIFVTDKWKHCVHVFSKEGDYVRSIGQKGSKPGMFRSPEGIATDNANNTIYVVDTGNDRVQILQPDGKYVDQIGVVTKMQASNSSSVWEVKEVACTELNSPTSVAVSSDRVVILDSGNRRVKVYNKADKNKITEFGALGQRKGQFRQPEVLTVDPMGFILVGDSGNSRVQVFKPNGQLVRAFGGLGSQPGKFGWISGIYVTKQLDIIVSDTKNRSVSFF